MKTKELQNGSGLGTLMPSKSLPNSSKTSQKKKTLLFLDIDGVLNSSSTTNFKNNLWPYDPYMAFLVGKIQLDTDCDIVLSSSWRYHPDGQAEVRKLVTLLDVTPMLNGSRGEEIQAWLDSHPEYDRYAILDDDTDMLPEQLPNFFQTTFETGLTDEIAKAVTAHLNT